MKIIHVIGRLGMGGDTVAVMNAMNVLKEENKINDWQIDFLTHDIGYDADFASRVSIDGHNVFVIAGDVRKMGMAEYYKAVLPVLKENGPYDVIHVHTGIQAGVALLAAKRLGIPKRICHSHVNGVQRKASKVLKRVTTPIFRMMIHQGATENVACSTQAGRFMFGRASFKIVNNGIPIEKFERVTDIEIEQLRDELGADDDTYIVGHIGRFSMMKNQAYILRLARKLKNEKNILFVLVGNGEQLEQTKKIIEQEDLNILCLGRRNDIAQLTRVFDMLLLPSLEGEGFSITLVEGQAGFCKCLVSDCVPKAADLGMGLLDYHSLDDIDYWVQSIAEKKKKQAWSDAAIKTITQRRLSDIKAAEDWYNLYID